VPTKNNEKNIGNCLKSLASLDYPKDRYEIIISDGHSSDGTVAIARGYDATVLEDNGCCRASGCNVGYEKSKGEFVAFTDADCMVDEKWLKNGLKYFRDMGVAGVGGPNLPPRSAPNLTRAVHVVSLLSPLAIDFNSVHEVRSLAGCNAIYRKSLLAQSFPLPETKAAEDTLLNFKIVEAGSKLLSAPDVIVWHDRHYKTRGSLFKQMMLYGKANAQINRIAPGILMPLQRFEALFLPIFSALFIVLGIYNLNILFLTLGFSAFIFIAVIFGRVFSITKSIKVAWLGPQALFLYISGFSIGYIKETLSYVFSFTKRNLI
jgi:succinoglycan biosynthesis protein ExoA